MLEECVMRDYQEWIRAEENGEHKKKKKKGEKGK